MLEEFEGVLDVKFREDLDISDINIEDREDGKQFRKEGSTLHVNIAPLDKLEREGILKLAEKQFEEMGRVLRYDEEQETHAMETGYDDDAEEILSYFDTVLSQRYLDIIEKSLHLRFLIEERGLSKSEIQEKKGQIARRHGSDAIYLSSLTNAGYFDPNGGLRDLFVDMGLNPEYSKYHFQSTLEEYLEKELLCVFVESDDSVSEVIQEVRGGLARYQHEDPIQEWYDVRGIGDGCSAIIDGVMSGLEKEFIGIDYDRWRSGDDLWVRIYPRSLPPITS